VIYGGSPSDALKMARTCRARTCRALSLRAVVVWGVALFLCGLNEGACRYTAYDIGASLRAGCTQLTAAAECLAPNATCLPASAVAALSPRWLGSLAGNGGPLISWVPMLLLALRPTRSAAQRLAALSALQLTLVWYLALIGPVRHTHTLASNSWDPSGHVFVYGAQLVPLWLLPPDGPAARRTAAGTLLDAWAVVLLYLSVATACFYHTLSETAAGYALTVLLALALRAEADDAGGRLQRATCAAAAALWIAFTVVGWWDLAAAQAALRGAQLAYDLLLWALLAWLSAALARGARGAGGEQEGNALASRGSSDSSDTGGG